MNNILLKNLEILKKTSPLVSQKAEIYFSENPDHLQFQYNKENLLYLKRNGLSLHSLYRPYAEAKQNVESFRVKIKEETKSIIVKGAGLFYHIEELLTFFEKIYLVETDTILFYELLAVRDLSSLLKRIILLTPDVIDTLRKSQLTFQEQLREFCYLYKNNLCYKHLPSVKTNYENYKLMCSQLIRLAVNNPACINLLPKLKILLTGPVYGGSLPMLNYCYEALKDLNQEVHKLDFSAYREAMQELENSSDFEATRSFLLGDLSELLSKVILTKARELDVQLVISLAQSPLTPKVCEKLREVGILTAFWFVEDFRTLNYWKNLSPHTDFFFTIQKDDFFKELTLNQTRNFHYLPVGFSPKHHLKEEISAEEKIEYQADISFVGAGYYNRQRTFISLLDYDFKLWGNDWPLGGIYDQCLQRKGERISPAEINKIFNSSIINLNLHSSTYVENVNPEGDFVNPRTFEIAGSENFQLVDERILLSEAFNKDEIVTYKSVEELRDKIDYFLKNPEEREFFISKSKKRVLAEHTYKHRMFEMLITILKKEPLLNSLNPVVTDISKLKEELKANNINLGHYLDRLPADNRTMEGLVKLILDENRDLTDDENRLLLLYEFYRFAKRKKII